MYLFELDNAPMECYPPELLGQLTLKKWFDPQRIRSPFLSLVTPPTSTPLFWTSAMVPTNGTAGCVFGLLALRALPCTVVVAVGMSENLPGIPARLVDCEHFIIGQEFES